MFSLASSTVLALALASCTAAHSFSNVRRHHQMAQVARATPPKGWATGYLEDYNVYHERYLAVGCENKHNTTFFDFCCHPMLATETLAKNRQPCCVPGATVSCPGTSTSASSSAAAPASTDSNEDDDEDCEDDDDDSTVSNEDDNGDDDDQDCEDEDDGDSETSAVVHTTSTTHDITTTTHTTPKPTTTSTKAAVTTPKTTHTTTKATTASTATTSTKTSSSSSSNEFITGGHSTWFTQGGVAGACGRVHQDSDFIVALPTKAYANGVNCGRQMLIVDTATGKSAKATVADECPGCDNAECLDMSLGLFKEFASLSLGVFNIKYQYLD